jgi:serine/threonine protein phosphatase PrpC
MKFEAIGISDVGSTRPNNEDVWISLPEIGFFALADGMGGRNAGEIAAQKTIDLVSEGAMQILKTNHMDLILEIRAVIEKANRHVHEMGLQNQNYQGMGTTLCCLLWTPTTIIYAHVGDSRIYRFRENKLSLLTQDHSLFAQWLATGKLAEECVTPYPYKHVITRAIGGSGKANPEIAIATQQEGDLFFLCSDGLTDVLSLEEMEQMLIQEPDLTLAAEMLIERAKFKGSSDNMTIVMVQHAKNLSRQ